MFVFFALDAWAPTKSEAVTHQISRVLTEISQSVCHKHTPSLSPSHTYTSLSPSLSLSCNKNILLSFMELHSNGLGSKEASRPYMTIPAKQKWLPLLLPTLVSN